MYSTVTMIGPLRGSISTAICGSRQRLKGSRLSAVSGVGENSVRRYSLA